MPLGCTDEVVVKIMKPEQHPRFGLTSNEEQQRALNREAKVALEVAKLNLPHVVKLHGYSDCAGAPPDTALAQARYALVMEYCELGCLKDVMRKLTWRWVAIRYQKMKLFHKIAAGLLGQSTLLYQQGESEPGHLLLQEPGFQINSTGQPGEGRSGMAAAGTGPVYHKPCRHCAPGKILKAVLASVTLIPSVEGTLEPAHSSASLRTFTCDDSCADFKLLVTTSHV